MLVSPDLNDWKVTLELKMGNEEARTRGGSREASKWKVDKN